MGAHSLIGPSAAKRTLACPGWVGLVQKDPVLAGGRSSIFAAEGSLAHDLAEKVLLGQLALPDLSGQTFEQEGYSFTPDDDFVLHVEAYVDYVESLRALGYDVKLETRVSVDWLWDASGAPRLPMRPFGTADCIAYHPAMRRMVVADLKFGRGVTVAAGGNPQLRTYGLGALETLGRNNVDEVEIVIVQPRTDHEDGTIRNEVLSVEDLIAWGYGVLMPGLAAAFEPDARLEKSSECRFCPASGVCPVRRASALDTAKHIFATPPEPDPLPQLMTPGELGRLLDQLDSLESWTKSVRDYAHRTLENGGRVEGHKLVDKRAVRRWADDDVEAVLGKGYGLSPEWFTETTVLSPAKVEASLKRLSKSGHPQATKALDDLDSLTVKRSSGTTVAKADDPRPSVAANPSAKDAFNTPPENL